MTNSSKPNTAFWIIAVIALLWNAMGVVNFLGATLLKDAMAQSYSAEEMALMDALPSWYMYVFGVAVFAGLLASILLLIRKRAATTLFLASLLAILLQMGYWLFATEVMEVIGATAVIMPLVVIIVGIFLYNYSRGAAKNGWLR